VFASRGFDHARLEDLAEVTGVPRATLYYYFAGKAEILAWLIRRTLAAITEGVGAAAGGDGPASARLEAIVTALLRVMSAQPDTCTLLSSESGRIMRMPELVAAVEDGFHRPVQRVLAEGEADGSLRRVESAETTSAVIWGAVFAAGIHYQVAAQKIDPERVAPQVVELLLGGLTSDGTRP
jgi:AcrR family transcriptional regulator